ncbi:MAG TPA: hypothetical protein VNW15_15820 [Rhizomicrobium sp.]|jgi:hypothetical protein|nr:hypothetical protein [Rhizomicrobium sp.]
MDSEFSTRTKGKRGAWKKKAIQGAVLVAVGLAPIATLAWYESSRNFVPVDVPMPPQPAAFHTDTFLINYSGTYSIDYRVPRTLPAQNLQCLLGLEDQHPDRCPDGQPQVTISWKLRTDENVVAQGQADHWQYSKSDENNLSAGIGLLHVNPGAYALEISIRSDFRTLAALRPRLVVEIQPGETEWFATAYIPAFFFGLALVLVGLWKLGGAVVEGAPRR